MDKIKRFIECLVPVTACNLKCDYCYVIQQNRRKNELPKFKYSPEHIAKALSKERLGGTSYISICGAGETLIQDEVVNIVKELLKEGHFVNVTTNGTLTNRFEEFEKFPKEFLERLHFAFSFHYLELKKRNLLEKFFSNVKRVKKLGCSFVVQLNLYDKYIEDIEEIKKICKENIGAYPQIAATRDESDVDTKQKYKLYTKLSKEEYKEKGQTFNSKLFDFTMKNFMVKRKEFCYAGDWSLILDLTTGNTKKCYCLDEDQNIFENIEKPIKFEAVGNSCPTIYCFNSSHFLSLGDIPTLNTPSYAELRNREEANWYNEKTKAFLSTRLYESNDTYKTLKKIKINTKNIIQKGKKRIYRMIKKNGD